jgi:hypothetical protein
MDRGTLCLQAIRFLIYNMRDTVYIISKACAQTKVKLTTAKILDREYREIVSGEHYLATTCSFLTCC